jgi:valyl-tRNA synthetase
MWHHIADDVIEKTKTNKELYPLLNLIFKDCLKVLSVFMPFVTEEIWQNLYSTDKSRILSITSWPKY